RSRVAGSRARRDRAVRAGRRPDVARQAPLGDGLPRQGDASGGEALVNILNLTRFVPAKAGTQNPNRRTRGALAAIVGLVSLVALVPAQAMQIERVKSALGIEAWLVRD